ncbi:MAG: glutamate--tRNA ligase [Gemmatimonadota bacterium]
MTLRLRFAPSPTGFLHVGGARTALFNWLLARKEGGVFALRIEDTDQERSSEEMVEAILAGLSWLGLDWDEGPFFQSLGIDRHRADVAALLERGAAYRDFTTPDELVRLRVDHPTRGLRFPREAAEALRPGEAEEKAAAGEPHAVRFRIPDGETVWEDRVHGKTRFRNADIEDLVLLRTDGTPTYNLAVASDDAEMRINLVIRGDDHISNTPKQILIYEALGHPVPGFAHVPMILGTDGKRLSKRHGATAIGEYAGQGILPEAMVNFLALLGWSPGTDEEVLTRDELVARFSLDRILKKSSVFDTKKLEWLNGQHLARKSPAELAPLLVESLPPGERERTEAWIESEPERFARLVRLLQPRSRSLTELAEQSRAYVLDPPQYDPEAEADFWLPDLEGATARLFALQEKLGEIETWEGAALERALRTLAEERGEGAAKLIHPLRVAVTGRAVSPGIFEVLMVLGRDRAMARIGTALDRLESLRNRRS